MEYYENLGFTDRINDRPSRINDLILEEIKNAYLKGWEKANVALQKLGL